MTKGKTAQTVTPMPPPKNKPTAAKLPYIKYYLIAYNVLSTLGWGYILVLLFVHVLNIDGKSSAISASYGTASSAFSRFFPYFKSNAGIQYAIESKLPGFLAPIFRRFTTSYLRVGTITAFVQTCALLEVAHSALGWVRSPIVTTAMQVSSRLYAVWGVTEQFPEVRSNPLYTTMVFAWAVAEVIRYSFYAANLLGKEPYPLLYLRYTAFWVLYPLGASSEAFLNYATLPNSSPMPSWSSWAKGMWKPTDYVRGALFLIWWPALYVMMSYMVKQRSKVLRPSKGHKLN
ncbi:PTPLA-domain-containing protein [Cylindrobasidium torrendii FP15055 ss-10]|uniref:Very-long-chain (3R)-3-hydroxyacyl-CoA dehydratase n=1 Tax=Cylindrobasidium torrendii FP15055 ss-10 TaxID=1314674 RepID=A0A0D7BV43_9AGAR|nr:PTPLA-domain-containing protein [Cylindrobasidium torrendii FP15055 ss-10]